MVTVVLSCPSYPVLGKQMMVIVDPAKSMAVTVHCNAQ